MVVCNYCSTTVYWGDDQVLQTGEKSVLPESDARLYLHATGKLGGEGYEVIGHVRYDHGRGNWDEWYLQLNNGSVAWISEDERKLTMEVATQADAPIPQLSQLAVGTVIPIGQVPYSVRELARAKCIGSEGQLPFPIMPAEEYPFADLASADGQHFATLEYDEAETPTCFLGHPLDHESLQIDEERPPSTAAPKAGKHIKCGNCNGPLEVVGGREVQTQVCEYCGAQLNLTSAEATVMGVNPPDFDPQFTFEIGKAGTFERRPYEICGRMLYQDTEGYLTREYLLYNADAGYLWLAEENNHFTLSRPTQEAPSRDPFPLAAKSVVKAGSDRFRKYESGTVQLVYVDGALPWLAKSNDTFRYTDLVAPPKIFGMETDGQEVEYFRGHYLSSTEVWQAFELPGKAPRGHGVHPAQPFVRGGVGRLLIWVGLLFGVINLGLLFWSLGQSGQQIFQDTYDSSTYLQESMSKPIKIGEGKVLTVKLWAPLNNSWMAVDMVLVNANDEVVEEMDGEFSYYQGYEGGESWSEGSYSTTRHFLAPAPGTYHMLFKANAGSGNGNGPPRGERLKITILQGAVLSRYFGMAFLLTIAFPFFALLRQYLFEKRRWAPVMEDDDDDNDSSFDWD